MTRITNNMRDHIVTQALKKSGVTAGRAALKEKRFDWAERCRIKVLGGRCSAREYAEVNRQANAAYEKLPTWMREHNRIAKRGKSFYLNLGGLSLTVELRDYVEVPTNRQVIEADQPAYQEFYDLKGEEDDLDKRADEVSAQVRAVIGKFTTVAQLLNAWPEAAELLPPIPQPVKSQLPAIPVADLNKLVGLPSEVPANDQ